MKSCFWSVVTVSVSLGFVAACGGSQDDVTWAEGSASPEAAEVEAEDAAEVAPGAVEQLHQFDVAGTRYTILAVDGELSTSFNRSPGAPIARVVSTGGEKLTLLEMFKALQPQGVPHQRLVDDHLAQVEWLEREDTSIHEAVVELTSTVDKTLQDDCVVAAAGYTGGTFAPPHYTKSGQVTVINGTFTSARTSAGERGDMLLLACNYSTNAQTETVGFAKKTGTGSFVPQFTEAIVSGGTAGIIQNTGNGVTRYDLRGRLITTPNVPMIFGVFAEAR